jgi:hypothetical protein
MPVSQCKVFEADDLIERVGMAYAKRPLAGFRYLYALELDSGRVKVGVSVNPANRIAGLRSEVSRCYGETIRRAAVSPCCRQFRASEAEAHNLLSAFHDSGEYFACTFEAAVAVLESISYLTDSEEGHELPPGNVSSREHPTKKVAISESQFRAIKMASIYLDSTVHEVASTVIEAGLIALKGELPVQAAPYIDTAIANHATVPSR